MPQEFYVLRCFSCDTFQVHIVKKAKKWECKMCGVKQSLKRNYGKGSSKDCRAQVMKLNELRMLKSETPNEFDNEDIDEKLVNIDIPEVQENPVKKEPGVSKWAEYLDEETKEESEENEEDFYKTLFENKKESKKRTWDTDKRSRECNNRKKKMKEEENKKNVSHAIDEEQSHSFETLNSVENFKFNNANEKTNDNHSLVQSKSTGKQSKYSKYLDEDESENNDDLLGNVKKRSNIFDTDPSDLDSILNF